MQNRKVDLTLENLSYLIYVEWKERQEVLGSEDVLPVSHLSTVQGKKEIL